jgi:KUP system potassium uptake protein
LNGLDIMVGDVGNAYLEAFTKEKVCFIAGPEFGELEGHMMIIVKALYGLRTSGARYWERFADTLRAMGFAPSWADGCVWMRDAGTHWEYVCVYVDDLMAIMTDPKAFFDELQGPKYKYKLKGVAAPSYHLGGDFSRDADGTYVWGAKTYVKRLIANYELMFGQKPKEWSSPAEHGDHPETDTSELLDADGIRQYMSLLGALQWSISLCRFDVATAVMTLGRFRVAPRIGHMERVKRVCGYLRKYPDAAIRFRTGIPNYDGIEIPKHDWMYSVYGEASEELPPGMPTPKGKPVRTSSFVDANLMHDLTTGRSATGIIHLVNQTPIEWFSKRQNTVETATFGSEFVAARQCTEQVYDLRYTLRMMGIPLDGTAYMFGDNQSVITQSTIPHSVLSKRHNALAYHRVREAVSAGVVYFLKIDGKENIADCLTKFLTHSMLWPMIEPLLFWKGETVGEVKNVPG